MSAAFGLIDWQKMLCDFEDSEKVAAHVEAAMDAMGITGEEREVVARALFERTIWPSSPPPRVDPPATPRRPE